MYFIVNLSLKMSSGKTAAQCCHVNTAIIRMLEKPSEMPFAYKEWLFDGEATIILGADNEQFNEIYEQFKGRKKSKDFEEFVMCDVVDAGRTEVKSGTRTVLGFTPMHKHEAPECIQNLATLK